MNSKPELEKIEEQLSETRSELSQTLNELERRISPSALEQSVEEAIHNLRVEVEENFENQLKTATIPLKKTIHQGGQFLSHYRIPMALGGLVIGWLLLRKDAQASAPVPIEKSLAVYPPLKNRIPLAVK